MPLDFSWYFEKMPFFSTNSTFSGRAEVAAAGVPKAMAATVVLRDNIHITNNCDTTVNFSQLGHFNCGQIVAHADGTRVDYYHRAKVGGARDVRIRPGPNKSSCEVWNRDPESAAATSDQPVRPELQLHAECCAVRTESARHPVV
jgi:hypothetical protein